MTDELSPLIARWIESMDWMGANASPSLRLVVLSGFAMILALLIWWLGRFLLDKILHGLAKRTRATWDDKLLNRQLLNRLAFFLPLAVLSAAANLLLPPFPGVGKVVKVGLDLAQITTSLLVFLAAISGIEKALESLQRFKDKPIASFSQLIKVVVSILAGIAIIATLSGQEVGVILGGLGAATAVILLVFKDALLGLTASVQLSSGDLVRIGDWVAIDKYGADGNVVEINLTTVKVQNWDMTFTIVPTYALISDSFKNWRGMSQSGGRRIKRHITIRPSSVKFADPELLASLEKVQVLRPWLDERRSTIAQDNEARGAQIDASPVNGRRLTNLGLFRSYTERYLRNHPGVNTSMTLLVRHLQPTAEGIPVEFYCFSRNQEWAAYEDLMADILDHLVAALPAFDLEIFEYRFNERPHTGGS
jgi:miniconductance mechanosensitive channel